MNFTPIEELFRVFDETANILQEELDCTYLEALAETGENIFHGDVIQDEISELNRKHLQKHYGEIKIEKFSKEEIRKSFQLAILKGMQQNIQPNHQMTPDAVGMFVSYLAGKFMSKIAAFTLLDPAVGTGNLLFTVMNHLSDKDVHAVGSDVDETLIRLSYVGANLQEQSVQFFNQDSLDPLFVDPVDVVVSDLPVGYYPNDVRAADYEMQADKGHSYAHHLFIEQSVRHIKEGGYLFFIVPNSLFESEQAPKLNSFVKEYTFIQGMVQLPISLFKNEAAAKSILILQKKKEGLQAPKKAMLVSLPKMSNRGAMQTVMNDMDIWFKEEK
ncbi:SAM-dependent methyltransferase [Bacillus sp. M6-12]|uniref:class I SAM-dependent methyltransferase n=1 Tax=Bacillus sp. M6-12 TaxID=2054166 RepID=UPI000C76E1D1|nr:class I SAM-dependent methyltransferase [Bacillus sp. M6-12]PLS14969.1 SAM-dependent methyltransferase [Bacillus sp. M6-12]